MSNILLCICGHCDIMTVIISRDFNSHGVGKPKFGVSEQKKKQILNWK